MKYELALLGRPRLRRVGEEPDAGVALERKAAAVLAYLALEGPTSRSKLAGFLWPESIESTARNNLVQTLRRLKRAVGEDVIRGDDPLALHADVEADARQRKLDAFHGTTPPMDALVEQGELLEGLEYDDCVDFADWLWSERESLRELRIKGVTQALERAAADGLHRQALALAERLLSFDPLSEGAYRHAMRLQYLLGERSAALRTFERCRDTLERELGVTPMPETEELARQIQSGSLPEVREARVPEAPAAVARPPVLVGRDDAWARLERAWAVGLPIFVSGAAGVGKSRLVMEFAKARGVAMLNEGRPGDAAVPFISLARGYRRALQSFGDLVIPAWVRREVGRLLPELADDMPPPILAPEERLRFHDGIYAFHRLISERIDVIVVDDIQYYDASSWDAAAQATNRLVAEGRPSRSVASFRPEEMPPSFLANIRELAERGAVEHIELEPLDADAVAELTRSFGIAELEDRPEFARQLHRYTGGNPLFVLETVRHLSASNALAGDLPEHLPPPSRIGAITRRRIDMLSPQATRAAQAAAILQSDFDIDLVGRVLRVDALELVDAFEELERAHVLQGSRFEHDLIYETVRMGISAPVAALLHRRVAETLEASAADPARVARHWLEANEPVRALPLLLRAAERAESTFRFVEATQFYEEATRVAQEFGVADAVIDALYRNAGVIERFDTSERYEAVARRLLEVAQTPVARAKAALIESTMHYRRGGGAAAVAAASRGLASLDDENAPLAAELRIALAKALWLGNRFEDARVALEETIRLAREAGDVGLEARALTLLGKTLTRVSRHRQALVPYGTALSAFERTGDRFHAAVTLTNISVSHEILGQLEEAAEANAAAERIFSESTVATRAQYLNLVALGSLQSGLERYADALAILRRADGLTSITEYSRSSVARALGVLFGALGDREACEREFLVALAKPDATDPIRSYTNVLWALALSRSGREDEAEALLARTERKLTSSVPGVVRAHLQLTRSLTCPADEALARVGVAERLVIDGELDGLVAMVELRRAQALGRLGRHEEAYASSLESLRRAREVRPFGQYAKYPFWAFECGRAVGADGVLGFLAEAARHVVRTLRNVPEEYRESFVTRNASNRAVLDAAAREGIDAFAELATPLSGAAD